MSVVAHQGKIDQHSTNTEYEIIQIVRMIYEYAVINPERYDYLIMVIAENFDIDDEKLKENIERRKS